MGRDTRNGFERLERRTLLAHVGLDLNFGDAGYANFSGSMLVAAVKGGKVLAVSGVGAVRLNGDGSIDETFYDRGARSDLPLNPQAASVIGQKFYVGGTTTTPVGEDQVLAVYVRRANLTTGTPDISFGDAGVATFIPTLGVADFSVRNYEVDDIAAAPDGGLFVSVFEPLQEYPNVARAWVIHKLTGTGQLDTTFGDNGAVIVNPGTETDYQANGAGRMVVYPDGDFVIVTGDDSEHFLRRFHADGSPDTSFGMQGVISLFGGNTHNVGLFLQDDGKVDLTFSTGDISGTFITGHIYRYNQNGTPDNSFAGDGKFDSFGFVALARDPFGRFIGLNDDNDLFRITSTGVLDTTFDDDGLSTIPDLAGRPIGRPDYFAGFTLNAAADASGNLLLGRADDVTRFAERERVALAPGGLVYIDGTDNADEIGAAVVGDNVVVALSGSSWGFPAAQVTGFIITAANGNDSIDLAVDRDASIYADEGDDSIRTAAGADMIICGPGIDTVDSGGGKDLIFGGDGDDSIYAGDGDDRVFGEYGADSIAGGAGNDRLYGGHSYLIFEGEYTDADYSADSISGNAGNDRCDGQFGDDRVAGNGGRDQLFGDSGDDRLYGGAGGDWLYGESGADQLFGEGGLDRLYSDDGDTDTLHGNAGDDIFASDDGVVDYLFGDGGHDFATADPDDVPTSIEAFA